MEITQNNNLIQNLEFAIVLLIVLFLPLSYVTVFFIFFLFFVSIEVLFCRGGFALEGSAIVYCPSKKEAERVTAALCKLDIPCGVYHAGLSIKQRRETQHQFMRDEIQVNATESLTPETDFFQYVTVLVLHGFVGSVWWPLWRLGWALINPISGRSSITELPKRWSHTIRRSGGPVETGCPAPVTSYGCPEIWP